MKTKTWPTPHSRLITLTACALCAGGAARAQNALSRSVISPDFYRIPTNSLAAMSAPDVIQPAEDTPLKFGPVRLRPHVEYRYIWGDGIQSSPGQREKTSVNQVAPGMLLDLGRYITLDYTPALTYYTNKRFKDTLDHSATLAAQKTFGPWDTRLTQNYVASSSPLIETGAQTDQETYTTTLHALRNAGHLTFDLGADQNFISTQDFANSRNWRTLDWVDYNFSSRFSTGVGLGFGYTDFEHGSNIIDESAQARASWSITHKISAQGRVGALGLEFPDGRSDTQRALFGGALQYQPFSQTRISVEVGRGTAPSLLRSGVTEDTAYTGGITQRLLGKLTAEVTGGYHTTKYIDSSAAPLPSRKDEYWTFMSRLGCPFLKRGHAAIFYQFTENTSNESGFSFHSNQVGLELAFRY